MRDELLNETLFLGHRHARTKLASWATDYNTERPHSGLGYLTPAAQAALLTATGDRLRNPDQLRRSPVAPSAPERINRTGSNRRWMRVRGRVTRRVLQGPGETTLYDMLSASVIETLERRAWGSPPTKCHRNASSRRPASCDICRALMKNTFGLNRSLGGAILAIAIVAALSSWAVLDSLRRLDAATNERQRSYETIRAVDAFLIAMLNQETGLRGYLITGRKSSLEPYDAGRPQLDRAIDRLHDLIGDKARQRDRLTSAETAARAWQQEIGGAAVREMDDPGTRAQAVALEAGGAGKRHFDVFREKLRAISEEEGRALLLDNAILAKAQKNARMAIWAAALTTFLICGIVALAINRLIVEPLQSLAGAMTRLATRDLEVSVPGTHHRNEVGGMARAVEVFKSGLVELNRTSLLRVTADTLPAMVGYVDERRRVGFLNGEFAAWFDLQVEDVSQVIGQPLTEAFARDPFPGSGRELEDAFAGCEMRSEHRLARRGSGRRDVEAFFRPHRAPDGHVLGVVTLLTDITDRKRMERRLSIQARNLMRSNEELEQFAYVASHDLKAPLRGIENLVGWIEEDLEGTLSGDTRTNMDLLKSRVRRLESLLDDLLAYSRAGRLEAVAEDVDVGKLVEDLAVLVSPPDGFIIEGSSALPVIRSARAPLTQAIQNLIGNAVKHHDHPEDGHVWIESRSSGALVEFGVIDDGPGIPSQFRERVFGMFQTLKPRDEVEGSGMGLAIVRKLVDRQGGKIWVDDGRNGRGVAMRFTWPQNPKGIDDGSDGEPSPGR